MSQAFGLEERGLDGWPLDKGWVTYAEYLENRNIKKLDCSDSNCYVRNFWERVSFELAEEPLLHGLEEQGTLTTTRRPEEGTAVLDKLWSTTPRSRVVSVSACPEAGSAVSSKIMWVPRPMAEELTITPGKLVYTGAVVRVMGAACGTKTSIASGMGRHAPIGV